MSQKTPPPTPGRSEEMLRALNAAATAIQRAARSPDAVIEAGGRELGRLRLHGAIILLDEARENLTLRHVILDPLALAAVKKLLRIDPTGLTFPRTRVELYDRVLATGRAVVVPYTVELAAQILPESLRPLAGPVVQATGYRESIVAPLTVAGERIGLLAVAGAALTAADIPAITAFADQISAALENAQLYEQLACRERETAAINAIVQALNASRNVREVFGAVARELETLVPFDRASIALPGADQQSFTVYALVSPPDAPLGEGVTMPLAATAAGPDAVAGRPHLTPDLSAETDYPAERLLYQAGLRSRVNVPLMVGDRVLGALNLGSTRPAAFTPHHLDLLQQVAGAIAAALQNAQLYERIQASEARFRHLVENVHDLIYEVDAQGVLTYCSPSLESVTGYKPETLIGRHFSDLIHPDDLPTLQASFERTLQGQREPWEFRVRLPDGRMAWMHSSSQPTVRDGQVMGMTGVLTDITARKLAEQALQRRNAQLAALSRIGQAITASLDSQHILATIASQAAALLGADAGGICEWAADGETMVVNVAHGLRPAFQEAIRAAQVRADQGAAIGRAILRQEPVHIPDVRTDPTYRYAALLQPEGYVGVTAAPMRSGERMLGGIILWWRQPITLPGEDLTLLATLADQAAIALENARLYEESQRRLQELEALLTTAQHIASTRDLDAVLRQVIESAITAIGPAEKGSIHLYDEARGELVMRASVGFSPETIATVRLKPGEGYAGWVFAQQQPLILDDVQADPRLKPIALSEVTALKSALCVPLIVRDRAIGTLSLDNVTKNHAFTAEHQDLLTIFASQVAGAIENAGLFAALTQEKARLETLYRLGHHLSESLDLREVAQRALDETCAAVGAMRGLILVREPDGEHLRFAAVSGYEAESSEALSQRLHLHVGNGLGGWVAARRQAALVDDVTQDPRWLRVAGLDDWVRSALSVPLISGDTLVGVLNIYSDQVGFFRPEHGQWVESVAAVVAVAVQNARLFQEVQHRAETLAALHHTALDLAAQRALPDLLRAIVVRALDLLGVQSGGLYLYRPERDVLEWAVAVGPRHLPLGTLRRRGEGLSGKVWETGQPLVVDNYQHWPGRATDAEDYPFIAVVGVPIRWGERFLGVLNILGDPPRTFSPADVALLERFAPLAAAALEQARLLNEAQRRAEVLAALHETALDLSAQRTLPDVLQAIVVRAVDLLGAKGGGIHIYRPETDDLEYILTYRLPPEAVGKKLRRGEGLAGQVLATGKSLTVDDYSHWAGRSAQFDGIRVEAIVSVPLRWGERFLGVLDMEDHAPRTFSPADIALLEQLAPLAAAALEQARLLDEARQRATELGILYDVVTAAAASVQLDEVLLRSVNALRQALKPDSIALLLVEPGTGNLIVRAGINVAGEAFLTHQPVPHSATALTSWVADTGQPVLLADVRQANRYYPCDPATRSELCVPLCVRSRTIGVLNLESRQVGAFTEADLHLVSTLAGHLATVIDNARLVQNLRESEARYHALFEQANDAVFLETLEGRILDANAKACEMLGYSREELLTLSVADLLPPEVQAHLPQVIERQVRNGGMRMEAENVRKDGARVPVEVSTSLLKINSHALVLALVRDIGERKRLEEQLRQAQKMEAIGTLAGGIAHDFNNLLGAILGYASLMERSLPAHSSLRTPVETIIQAAQRGADLTRQLLAFARGGRYEVRPISLNDVAHEVVRLLGRTVSKTIVIEPRLAADLAAVEGDAGQLHQMLLNLCLNAADAMPAGGRLTIETANVTLSASEAQADLELDPGAYVRLRVTDTGIGMDPATMQRIFEPFFTTKKGQPGKQHSGLGLSMVYGIVRSHGGAIRVRSEVGRGTTFEVHLPAIARPTVLAAAPAAPSSIGGTETVLVVDDEVYVLNLLKQVLTEVGYSVLLAEDGLQALEIYQQHPGRIDLVVLDMGMPRLSGGETFYRLLKIDPQAAVLISSGYAEDEQARQMIAAGARGFLAKPYDVDELLTRVREVLDRKS